MIFFFKWQLQFPILIFHPYLVDLLYDLLSNKSPILVEQQCNRDTDQTIRDVFKSNLP